MNINFNVYLFKVMEQLEVLDNYVRKLNASSRRTSIMELTAFLTQASSRLSRRVGLRIYACGQKQTTRGDTSFRCQTHLAATNANLGAFPPAVSSSLVEFNYRDNNKTQPVFDRTSLKSSVECIL